MKSRFERVQRASSITAVASGADLGQQGRIFGLSEIVGEYQRALIAPEPAPVVEVEPLTAEQEQEAAWKKIRGVPVGGNPGVGRPSADWPA